MPGLGLVRGREAHREVEVGRSGRGVGVDLDADGGAPPLGGVGEHRVQQGLGHPTAAGGAQHTEVLHVGLGRVARRDRTDERTDGAGAAVVDELGDPPVVPAVAGVLAQAGAELLEGLLVVVEVVGERGLEDVVDRREVALHGQSVAAVAGHPADHDPVPRR